MTIFMDEYNNSTEHPLTSIKSYDNMIPQLGQTIKSDLDLYELSLDRVYKGHYNVI
jgi:hypothetical protein